MSRVQMSVPPFLAIKFCPFDSFFHKNPCTTYDSVTIWDFYMKLYRNVYQSPLISTELFQHNLINVSYLTACYFLNDVANDAESTQKSKLTS